MNNLKTYALLIEIERDEIETLFIDALNLQDLKIKFEKGDGNPAHEDLLWDCVENIYEFPTQIPHPIELLYSRAGIDLLHLSTEEKTALHILKTIETDILPRLGWREDSLNTIYNNEGCFNLMEEGEPCTLDDILPIIQRDLAKYGNIHLYICLDNYEMEILRMDAEEHKDYLDLGQSDPNLPIIYFFN